MKWDAEKPAILMIAGGDGTGPLYETARTIDAQYRNCQIAIIAGKNEELRERLDQAEWNNTAHIYGYVSNHTDMPLLMTAGDILVTKAGPSTITEACIAGIPMIISDAIPGQEDGNIRFVIENEAGVYAPELEEVIKAVGQWLSEGKEGLQRRADNARRIANPNAVWDIAEEVWDWSHHPPIKNKRLKIMDYIAEFTDI